MAGVSSTALSTSCSGSAVVDWQVRVTLSVARERASRDSMIASVERRRSPKPFLPAGLVKQHRTEHQDEQQKQAASSERKHKRNRRRGGNNSIRSSIFAQEILLLLLFLRVAVMARALHLLSSFDVCRSCIVAAAVVVINVVVVCFVYCFYPKAAPDSPLCRPPQRFLLGPDSLYSSQSCPAKQCSVHLALDVMHARVS